MIVNGVNGSVISTRPACTSNTPSSRYTGTLGAVDAEKLLVVFPNGSQHGVGHETVSLA